MSESFANIYCHLIIFGPPLAPAADHSWGPAVLLIFLTRTVQWRTACLMVTKGLSSQLMPILPSSIWSRLTLHCILLCSSNYILDKLYSTLPCIEVIDVIKVTSFSCPSFPWWSFLAWIPQKTLSVSVQITFFIDKNKIESILSIQKIF